MAEHLDAYELTDLALRPGARPTARQHDHLDRCARCRRELRQLREVITTARSVSTDDLLTPPPDEVWHAIAAELNLGTGSSPPAAGRAPSPPAETDAVAVGTSLGADGHRARVRAWLRTPAMLLAAASLVVGAVLGSAVTWWRFDDDSPDTDVSRANPLASLSVPRAAGTVRVLDSAESERTVRVSVTGLPRTDGYYEVWLMDRGHKKLIAMGVLGPDGSATLPLPAGIDLSRYPLIDVSAQANDGNPAHSGESVVRGSLPS
ncbi:anti-sigma factor [Streptomyces sp. NPDC006458]|uniref:anti-sigma factor n=1 Tax=Streptomyces sp. NPDC006458 TaxID=3154302 RepID=UPI00339FE9FD